MEVPEFFVGGGYIGVRAGEFSPDKRFSDQKLGEHFTIDDLLDFSNDDAIVSDDCFDNIAGISTDSSTVNVFDGCNSSVSGCENHFAANFRPQFSGELCIPYDELPELEWLSNFVEDSFSAKHNLQTLPLDAAAVKSQSSESSSSSPLQTYLPETPPPAKARSKRSRAAPCDWSTRVLHIPSDTKPPQSKKTTPYKKKFRPNTPNSDSLGQKCLHCAAEKTPQWRTGPLGPKTLCNACGVRYKSGRLVAEYRPAASPTFVTSKHSNSHRKVLELRRQNEMQRAHQRQQQFLDQSSIFSPSNGGDDLLLHHLGGPNYRHII